MRRAPDLSSRCDAELCYSLEFQSSTGQLLIVYRMTGSQNSSHQGSGHLFLAISAHGSSVGDMNFLHSFSFLASRARYLDNDMCCIGKQQEYIKLILSKL